MATRRGQAMVELAVGMFAIALVLSAVTLFAVFMTRSLREQNSARGPSPEKAEPLEVDAFAESYFPTDGHTDGPPFPVRSASAARICPTTVLPLFITPMCSPSPVCSRGGKPRRTT